MVIGKKGEGDERRKEKPTRTVGIQEAKKGGLVLIYLFIRFLFNFEIAQVCHAARKEAT